MPPKRNEARLKEMFHLHAPGLTGVEIARRLGVTHQYVTFTLARPPKSVPCSACGTVIVSAGALARDARTVLCLGCLGRRPNASFAVRLKSLRIAAGLTMRELAGKAGVTDITLGSYEKGIRVPKPRVMGKVVAVLGDELTRHLQPAQRPGGWAAEEEALLGTMSDEEVAKQIGRGVQAVRIRRTRMGIAKPLPPAWPADELALLGVLPDAEVAGRTGRSFTAVRLKRRELRMLMKPGPKPRKRS